MIDTSCKLAVVFLASQKTNKQMICISCKYQHDEKFCPNCGEHSAVKKITFSSILKDTFSTITNMDKGFLFNLKKLTTNPHEIITNYILGKRKKIYNPISFLILSVAIYLIGESFIKFPARESNHDSPVFSVGYAAGHFIFTHAKYFWILAIIWLSLSTKLIFSKYNYAEHIIISSFILGYATLAGLIGGLIFKLPLMFNPIVYIVSLLMIYQVFKKEDDKLESFFLSFASISLFFIQLLIISVIIGFITV